MKSKILEHLSKITPEKKEKWRQERLERKKTLTSQSQLGWFVGETIVYNNLPTLSTSIMGGRNVINVSEEDTLENKSLEEQWFKNRTNDDGKKNWDMFHQHNKMLEKKYLPNPLKCLVPLLNIEDMDDFKKGLRSSLYHSDICSYNIDNINIYDDKDYYFTIIELKLD